MSVTAHWLDDEFTSHIKCLSVKPIASGTTESSVATLLSEIIDEWNLNRNNLHHVTINGTDDMNEELSKVIDIVMVSRLSWWCSGSASDS